MARTVSTNDAAIRGLPDRATHYYITMEDGDGNPRDLTDLFGIDWVTSCVVSANQDDPISQATITLWREQDGISLATLMEGSPANRDAAYAYSPLVSPARTVEVHYAIVPEGDVPESYELLFRGTVDDPEWGGTQSRVTFIARDDIALLNDTVIEEEREYGDDDAPVAIETVMQSILTDNDTGYTLDVDGDPDYGIRRYPLANVTVLEALLALRDLQGWNLHMRWDGDDLALTYYEPDRDNDTPDHTMGPEDYHDLTEVSLGRSQIRNAGEIVYTNREGATPKAARVQDTRPASIEEFGRRFIRLDFTRSAAITTAAQATALLSAVLDDTEAPPVTHRVSAPFTPALELGDVVRYEANGVHYDTDQTLATYAYAHTLSPEGCRTEIHGRGKPSGGFYRWLQRESLTGPDIAEIVRVQTSYDDGTATVTVEGNSRTASLWYQEWNGSEWGAEVSIASASEGSFQPVQSTATTKLYRVYGKNTNGVAGPPVEVTVDKRVADPPAIELVAATVTRTSLLQAQASVTLRVEVPGGTGVTGDLEIWSAPAVASPSFPTSAPDATVPGVGHDETVGPTGGAADHMTAALTDIRLSGISAGGKLLFARWTGSDGRVARGQWFVGRNHADTDETNLPDVLTKSVSMSVSGSHRVAAVVVGVDDPEAQSGTLLIWSNAGSVTDADPTGAADQAVTLAHGQTAGPSGSGADVTASALGGIRVALALFFARRKEIFVEWVAADGRRSGVKPITLAPNVETLQDGAGDDDYEGNTPRRGWDGTGFRTVLDQWRNATAKGQNVLPPRAADVAQASGAPQNFPGSPMIVDIDQLGWQPGDRLSVSGQFRHISGGFTCRIFLSFINANPANNTTVNGPVVNTSTDWQTSALADQEIPAGTVSVQLELAATTVLSAGTAEARHGMLHLGRVNIPYEEPPFRSRRESGVDIRRGPGDPTPLSRAFAKPSAADPDTLDSIDGTRFVGNLPQRIRTGAGEAATNAVLDDVDMLASAMRDGLGRSVLDFFDKDGDNTDDISEATDRRFVTDDQRTGAGRAFAGLNVSNRLTTGVEASATISRHAGGTVEAGVVGNRSGSAGEIWYERPDQRLELEFVWDAGAGVHNVKWRREGSGASPANFQFRVSGETVTIEPGEAFAPGGASTKHWLCRDEDTGIVLTSNKMTALNYRRIILREFTTPAAGSGGTATGGIAIV